MKKETKETKVEKVEATPVKKEEKMIFFPSTGKLVKLSEIKENE